MCGRGVSHSQRVTVGECRLLDPLERCAERDVVWSFECVWELVARCMCVAHTVVTLETRHESRFEI